MSVTQLSDTSSTATSTRYVITEEEHQRQVERFHARVTSMFSKPQPVIDMRTYKPTNPLEFRCTADLTGRLYPHPGTPNLYLLDFIDNSGARCDDANLYIYPYIYGVSNPKPLKLLGGMGGRRGCAGIYTVPPGHTYEICNPEKQKIKRFSFMYKDRVTWELEPVLRD